jgi:hypothetical protein
MFRRQLFYAGEDSEMRAPMRWDWVKDDNVELKWMQRRRAVIDVLGTATKPIFMNASLITVSIPGSGYVILKPDVKGSGGYTNYKRVQ